jgi:hypothetical protein
MVLSKLLSSERYRPTALRRLVLEFTGVGDSGAVELSNALNNTILERLDFGQCSHIGNETAVALGAALKLNAPNSSAF